MKLLYAGVLLLLLLHRHVKSEMTEKQLQSAMKMMRSVCQPKMKVPNEVIEAMHQGEFVQERSLMCYMECCLRIGKMIKDGKLDYDSIMAQIKNVPSARQSATLHSITKCKDSGGSDDKCEAGFDIYKCIYDSGPENFYLP